MSSDQQLSEIERDSACLCEQLESMDRLSQAIWVYDIDHKRVLWCNTSGLPVWESESLEVLKRRDLSKGMSCSVSKRLSQYKADFADNENARFKELWTLYPKGEPTTLDVVFSSIRLNSGRIGMFCEGTPIKNLDAENFRSAEALLHTSVQISLYSATGESLYRNPAARSAVASTMERLDERFVDQQVMSLFDETESGEFNTVAKVNTRKGVRFHDITALRCMDAVSGDHAWLITEVDVSKLKATEEHAQFLAKHDILTQLPNRNFVSVSFQDRIDKLLKAGEQGCLVFIDLDHFKDVNDTLGHEAGDQLLIEVAKRLSSLVSVKDSVARLGGDEFLLILDEKTSESSIEATIAEIQALVAQPMNINSREIRVTPSVGLARFPNDGRNIRDLMRHADLAMYHAKDAGRNNFAFFEKKMSDVVETRINLESELLEALEQDQFVTHFQPRVNVATNEIIGAEALVRWTHPTKGMISPGCFIPACEESGLIKELGKKVLAQSVVAQREWAAMGLPIQVSVNLSPIQFNDPNLVTDVINIVKEYDGDPRQIELEITESVLLGNDQSTIEKLHTFVDLGFGMAIDDFGTGYSNLAYLHRYPISCIKIDRSFVQAMDSAQPIIELIVSMAHLFKMDVIAEGVETAEQLDMLKRYRCQEYQGFLFAKPMSLDLFTELLVQNHKQAA